MYFYASLLWGHCSTNWNTAVLTPHCLADNNYAVVLSKLTLRKTTLSSYMYRCQTEQQCSVTTPSRLCERPLHHLAYKHKVGGYLSASDQLAGGEGAVRRSRNDVVLECLVVLALGSHILRLQDQRRSGVSNRLRQRQKNVLKQVIVYAYRSTLNKHRVK